MTYYERLRRKKLGDLLVDEDVSSKESVITALHEHHQTSNPLSQILLQGGELTEYDLARVMVEQYQLPFLDLVNYTYHRDLIANFPPRLLHQARVVPLDRFGEVISFVVQEFPSDEVIAELQEYGTEKFFIYAAFASEIRAALQDHVPLHDDQLAEDTAHAAKLGAPVAATNMGEDGAWKELFDTANESVVAELPDEEADEPAPKQASTEDGLGPIEVLEPDESQGDAGVPAWLGGEGEEEAAGEEKQRDAEGEMPDWLSGGDG